MLTCYKISFFSGLDYELEDCGEKVCQIKTRVSRCRGELVMPCDLLQELDFGTTLGAGTANFEGSSPNP